MLQPGFLGSSKVFLTSMGQSQEHIVQFYKTESHLLSEVSQFISNALSFGEGIIIVASPEHITFFQKKIIQIGLDLHSFQESEQLVFLDAHETLSKLLIEGKVDWITFRKMVSGYLDQMKKKFSNIRIYGEMADNLGKNGNSKESIRLERFWNDLSNDYSFTLLCCHYLGGFETNSQTEAFLNLCQQHTHVIPAEDCNDDINHGEYNRILTLLQQQTFAINEVYHRTIAFLQQQTLALKKEVEERKQVELALQACESKSQFDLRMRDEFLSLVSHELKTPLTSFKLQMELAKRQFAKDDPNLINKAFVGKLIENGGNQIERLNKLVDNMLDSSRMENGKLLIEPERFDLCSLVREVVDRYSSQIDAAKSKYMLTTEGRIIGNWDRFRIEQVIANLISNAIKYGASQPIEISILSESENAVIRIKDHGIGIAKENQARIFNRFEGGKFSSGSHGLGLGLYLTKKIVDAHNGTIQVESELGKGSLFTVVLPLKNEIPGESL